MVQRKLFGRVLSVLMSAVLCFPAVAAEKTVAKIKAAPQTSLELRMVEGDSVRGKLVDRQGKPLANVDVKIANQVGNAAAKTAADGSFQFTNLEMGEYVIGVGNQVQRVRVWNAQTAPPKASQMALLVAGDTVRAQCGSSCDGCSSCAGAGPACGVPSPVCSPCESITSCGPSCGGCDSCGGRRAGLFGGHGHGFGGIGSLGGAPLLIGAGVAAAIAIPLAIDDDDDDDAS